MFKSKFIPAACLLIAVTAAASTANAALNSPPEGSTITTNPATFSWSGGAVEFWLRVYDSDTDTRIYDSGRLDSSVLSASVSLAESITSLRVVFYQKLGGSWASMESLYGVDLGGTTPPPPTGSGLPDGNAPGDRLVWDGDSWEPEQPVAEIFPPEDNMMPFQNIAFIIKIRGSAPPSVSAAGPAADTPFVGQIVMWAGTYPPKGWAFADGQVVVNEDFPELFSVLSNNYGNPGEGLFKLPDLRSRVPVHFGAGPGLTNRIIGRTGGYEAVHNLD